MSQNGPPIAVHQGVAMLPLDPAYVDRVSERVQRTERAEITVRQDIFHTHEEFDSTMADIAVEIAQLRDALINIEQDVASVVERVKHSLSMFKTVVKQGDMARLQSRVDLWAPETRITREQFARMLQAL